MWTRKAALLLTSGISLVLIGMMIANFQLMILGLMFIAFLAINSWVVGHGELEVVRTLSADNLYKGDDLYVELAITNSSFRRTQQLEVFDNVPHEMKLRSGLNYMRVNLGPGETTRIRYVLRCPLRGHYSFGPVSVRYRNTFNLYSQEMYIDHRSGLIVFPQVREIEEAMIRSRTPKMYTGAMTLRTPGPGSEFYSLREYVPGDPFKIINWKAFARTGIMMVNEKCRDAVTDVFILLDSRDISRIGTVLKNPLEMGTVAAASLASYFIKRRDSVALAVYDDTLSYLPADGGDKQYFKVLSSLTVPHAIRDLAGRGHEVVILSPSSIDYERLVSRIPRMSYEVMKLERQNRLSAVAGYGARAIDWMPDVELSQALLQVEV